VFRGYSGDEELLGAPRADDTAPLDLLRREVARLEPQKVYLPLGIGGHVDHQLMLDVGLALLGETESWVMPGHGWAGRVVFYEDFPYAWWNDFRHLDDLPPGHLAGLPDGISLTADYADVGDQIERKITGIAVREPARPTVRRHEGDGRRCARPRADDGRARLCARRGGTLLDDDRGLRPSDRKVSRRWPPARARASSP
jgi:hypothetical protein